MERDYEKEFVKWVLAMIEKYHMSRNMLGRKTNIDSSHMTSILRCESKATREVKYSIIDFFKNEYDERFVLSGRVDYLTFGDWLDNVMLKNKIKNSMIAEELNIWDSSILNMRKGVVRLDIEQRRAILELLKEKYQIDISKGEELLDKVENKYYKEIGEWISNVMKTVNINDVELSQCVDISKSTIYLILYGRIALSYNHANKIFAFFEKYGIDTSDVRKTFEEVCKYKEKIRYQV